MVQLFSKKLMLYDKCGVHAHTVAVGKACPLEALACGQPDTGLTATARLVDYVARMTAEDERR